MESDERESGKGRKMEESDEEVAANFESLWEILASTVWEGAQLGAENSTRQTGWNQTSDIL